VDAPVVGGVGCVVSGRGSQGWLDPAHKSVVAPGKRPRLTPAPRCCCRNGKLVMPFGTPGGDVQQQAMLQVMLNHVVFDMPLQQAIEASRVASRSFPTRSGRTPSRPASWRSSAGWEGNARRADRALATTSASGRSGSGARAPSAPCASRRTARAGPAPIRAAARTRSRASRPTSSRGAGASADAHGLPRGNHQGHAGREERHDRRGDEGARVGAVHSKIQPAPAAPSAEPTWCAKKIQLRQLTTEKRRNVRGQRRRRRHRGDVVEAEEAAHRCSEGTSQT